MSKTERDPQDLSKSEWKKALKETKTALGNKELGMFAAGVSYYATLAFFPALAAAVSIYALFVSPQDILALGEDSKRFMPAAMSDLITSQLAPLAEQDKKSLIGGIAAILIALFSASAGMQNFIKALNHAYDVKERRGWIKLRLVSLGFMAVLIVAAVPVIGLIVLQPSFLASLGVPEGLAWTVAVLRWIVLALVVTLVMAVVFRYAPDRREPRWSIVSWGGGAATLIWLLGTALFFVYVQYFSSFDQTYGVFAGIIILMSWLNLSAFIILLGAEVNHQLEEETETPEPEAPLGRRQRLLRWLKDPRHD